MKKIFIAALTLLSFGASAANAQSLSIGPFMTGKIGVNAGKIPEGQNTGIAFSIPDIGATLYYPFGTGSSIAGLFDVGYAQYAYEMKADGASSGKTVKYGYLNFAPGINFGGFTLGINFGVPMSAPEGGKTEDMATLMEFRIGGMIPLVTTTSGKLNFIVQGGYTLTGLTKEEKLKATFGGITIDNTEFNPKVGSLAFGINYLFNLGM